LRNTTIDFYYQTHWSFTFLPDAIASSENVRIAPSLRSQKGAIWTKSQTNFDWWEVDIVFRVSGRGRIGADGLVSVHTFFKNLSFNLNFSF
jgi:Legume-like lectin family